MPCNSTGPIRPSVLSNFSLVSIDWSNQKNVWVAMRPMDSENLLLDQALALHAAQPSQRIFVYRNLVIAYPWFPSVREKLVDPAYAGWFLKFGAPPFSNGSYHVPRCDGAFSPPLCSAFYHSQDQTPGYPSGDGDCPGPCDCGGVPCGFYLFNHANATLRRWLIDDFVFGRPHGRARLRGKRHWWPDGGQPLLRRGHWAHAGGHHRKHRGLARHDAGAAAARGGCGRLFVGLFQ